MSYDIPLKSNFLASYELQEFMLTSSESQFSMIGFLTVTFFMIEIDKKVLLALIET